MALTGTYAASSGTYETAEEGRYVCKLVKVVREDRASYDDPGVMEPNFVWDFETVKERDSKGEPYKFRAYTKTAYSNEKAKLTLLINGMFGRNFTREQFEQIDLEKMVGQTFAVMIGMTTGGKNKILSVKAGKGQEPNYEDFLVDKADRAITPPPRRVTAPSDDPFEDE